MLEAYAPAGRYLRELFANTVRAVDSEIETRKAQVPTQQRWTLPKERGTCQSSGREDQRSSGPERNPSCTALTPRISARLNENLSDVWVRQSPAGGTGVKHRGGELTLPVRQRPSYVPALSKVTPPDRAEPGTASGTFRAR